MINSVSIFPPPFSQSDLFWKELSFFKDLFFNLAVKNSVTVDGIILHDYSDFAASDLQVSHPVLKLLIVNFN
jgi:hypothetical protein